MYEYSKKDLSGVHTQSRLKMFFSSFSCESAEEFNEKHFDSVFEIWVDKMSFFHADYLQMQGISKDMLQSLIDLHIVADILAILNPNNKERLEALNRFSDFIGTYESNPKLFNLSCLPLLSENKESKDTLDRFSEVVSTLSKINTMSENHKLVFEHSPSFIKLLSDLQKQIASAQKEVLTFIQEGKASKISMRDLKVFLRGVNSDFFQKHTDNFKKFLLEIYWPSKTTMYFDRLGGLLHLSDLSVFEASFGEYEDMMLDIFAYNKNLPSNLLEKWQSELDYFKDFSGHQPTPLQ